jgi:putative membrane protein
VNDLWLKALHIISFTAWMAALFYLPRLFVYHAAVNKGSEADTLFRIMERRLQRIIMTPAMLLTFTFGLLLIHLRAGGYIANWG